MNSESDLVIIESKKYFAQLSNLVKYVNRYDSLSVKRFINLIYYPLWEDIALYECGEKSYTIMKEIELDDDLEKIIIYIYNSNSVSIIEEYQDYYTGEKNFSSEITDNPYPYIVKTLNKYMHYSRRDLLVQIYSWAIPNDKILIRISKFADKILEICAGTGYWSYLLKNRGVDIIATDVDPKFTWTNVIKEDYKKSIKTYQDRVVMLSWPVIEFFDLIQDGTYKQKKIIYIGEYAGCTGGLMPKLEEAKMIKNIEIIDIPRYWGMRDKGYLITLK